MPNLPSGVTFCSCLIGQVGVVLTLSQKTTFTQIVKMLVTTNSIPPHDQYNINLDHQPTTIIPK